MATNFDGRGPSFRGPSFTGPIITAIVCLVAIALTWLAYGYALNVKDGTATLPRWPGLGVELASLVLGAAAALLLPGRRGLILIGLGVVSCTVVDVSGAAAPVDPWFVAWIGSVCTVLSLAGYGVARVAVRLLRERSEPRH